MFIVKRKKHLPSPLQRGKFVWNGFDYSKVDTQFDHELHKNNTRRIKLPVGRKRDTIQKCCVKLNIPINYISKSRLIAVKTLIKHFYALPGVSLEAHQNELPKTIPNQQSSRKRNGLEPFR